MFSFPYISLLPSFSLSSGCSSRFYTVTYFGEICLKTKVKMIRVPKRQSRMSYLSLSFGKKGLKGFKTLLELLY